MKTKQTVLSMVNHIFSHFFYGNLKASIFFSFLSLFFFSYRYLRKITERGGNGRPDDFSLRMRSTKKSIFRCNENWNVWYWHRLIRSRFWLGCVFFTKRFIFTFFSLPHCYLFLHFFLYLFNYLYNYFSISLIYSRVYHF